MNIKKTSEKYNPLLERKEIQFSIDHPSSGTPQLYQTRVSLANLLKIKQDQVYIIKMKTSPGVNRTIGEAEVYDTAEKARQIIPDYIHKRNMSLEEKKRTSKRKGKDEKVLSAPEKEAPKPEEEKAPKPLDKEETE